MRQYPFGHTTRNPFFAATWALVTILAFGTLAGCGEEKQPSGDGENGTPPPADTITPEPDDTAAVPEEPIDEEDLTTASLMQKVIDAYQAANSYRDEGKLLLQFREGDEPREEQLPFSVVFERPNRLRFEALQSTVVSDGKTMRAQTEQLPDQVVVADAMEKLLIPGFYEIEAMAPITTPGLGGPSITMELLMAEEPLDGITNMLADAKLLESRRINGRRVLGINMSTGNGSLVLWIDTKSYELLEIELPVDNFARGLERQGASDVKLTAHLKKAKLNAEVSDDDFAWTMSSDKREVRFLVRPPNSALEPSKLLGKDLADITFRDIEGNEVNFSSLRGKTVIFDFWATWCGPCIQLMPHMNEIYQGLKDADDVAMFAVSIDEARMESSKVAATMDRLKAEVPILRPTEQDHMRLSEMYDIQAIPTTFVIDAKGKLQFRATGGEDVVGGKLENVIQRVRDGEDVASEAFATWKKLQEDYEVELIRARVGGEEEEDEEAKVDDDVLEIPRAEIAPRSEPSEVKLSKLWTSEEIKNPLNLLVVEEDSPRIFALSDWRSVVELNAKGEEVQRHDEILNQDQLATTLRTTTDADGQRYFLLTAPGMPHLHLFDESWQKRLTYPEGNSAQIFDAQFADLDGDNTPEMIVGYLGEVGIHGVTLAGERLWRNRDIINVARIAPLQSENGTSILCTHAEGTLMPINAKGEAGKPLGLEGRGITTVATKDLDGDGLDEICGLALGIDRKLSVVSLNTDGELLWDIRLPQGEHTTQIESITGGPSSSEHQGAWYVAAADGSIHIISADGSFHDSFNYGEALGGIAVARVDGATVLLVSTSEGVTAWQVELPATALVARKESPVTATPATTEAQPQDDTATPESEPVEDNTAAVAVDAEVEPPADVNLDAELELPANDDAGDVDEEAGAAPLENVLPPLEDENNPA